MNHAQVTLSFRKSNPVHGESLPRGRYHHVLPYGPTMEVLGPLFENLLPPNLLQQPRFYVKSCMNIFYYRAALPILYDMLSTYIYSKTYIMNIQASMTYNATSNMIINRAMVPS